MTRGFVTVATGKEAYYRQAVNMLHSFKLHNPSAKMAILCDRQNEYTEEFDDVIILTDVGCNYTDKFRLLTDCPYDENIFIETDCLIYRNLDFFWDELSREYDLTAFGWNDAPTTIWIQNPCCMEAINQFMEQSIDKYPIFNPGYMFIRNGEKVRKMYSDIIRIKDFLIEQWQGEPNLFVGNNLRDDPLIFIAMEMNKMRCPSEPQTGKCISVPSGYRYLKLDIIKGLLTVRDKKKKIIDNCSLLHFSTRRVREEGLYPWQVCVMDAYRKGRPKWWVCFLKSRFVGCIFCIKMYIVTRFNRLFCKKKAT